MGGEQELRKRKTSSPETHAPCSSNGSKGERKSKDILEVDNEASFFARLMCWLWLPEDASYLGIFRIGWGLIMTYEIWHYVQNNFLLALASFYSSKYGFRAKYYLFDFVEVMSFDNMQIFLIAAMLSAIFITIGFKYRLACIVFFFSISYIFLLDVVHYLNHIYLVIIISFIMIFMPCNCVYAVDSRKRKTPATVPKIVLVFLKLFLFIVYTYAGFVKMNEDWLRGEPVRHWIGKKKVLFGLLQYEATIYFVSYGGLFYDTFVGLMLLWDRTFWLGILLTLIFHTSNKLIFNIGIFPYVMIASTSLYFRPDWPRKMMNKLLRRPHTIVGNTDVKFFGYKPPKQRRITTFQKVLTFFVILFLVWWVLMPIRFLLMPNHQGPQAWTENGHMFSWRMKLRDRDCYGDYYGVFPDSKHVFIVPSDKILSRKQVSKYRSRPDSLLQYCHFLGDLYDVGEGRPEIYAYVDCAINYRQMLPFSNRSTDLASAPLWKYHDWILPYSPLPEELKSQYPWNWKFDDEWWNSITRNIRAEVKAHYKGRAGRNEQMTAEHNQQFIQWTADRFYNGNTSAVNLDFLKPPKEKRVVEYFKIPTKSARHVPVTDVPPVDWKEFGVAET